MPPPPAALPRAGSVLRWCLLLSSTPRQTVGHHAGAAKFEMGRKRTNKHTAERCPAEAEQPPRRESHTLRPLQLQPRWPREPREPTEPTVFFLCALLFSFPFIYPPTTGQGCARASGQTRNFPNPDKFICMANFKKRLTATKTQPTSRLFFRASVPAHQTRPNDRQNKASWPPGG
jgi:hypothetical protein